MGLGAPKRRNKLSHDPNNTAWSRSTTNFGHKILSQQGWQPGQYLGAEHANHSDHYTAANASHIRILLREDNLGLGAKVGGNKAETFGLSVFSDVLGRLNGKSDGQVQEQQDALRDAELRQYQVGKFGLMNFVSGGLLVGDKIEKKGEKDVVRKAKVLDEKKGKKRKATEHESGEEKVKQKKRKTSITANGEGPATVEQQSSGDESKNEESHRAKKSKKDKRAADEPGNEETTETTPTEKKTKKRRKTITTDDPSPAAISVDEKARLKQQKRARKEDRRKRKETKRLKKEAKLASAPLADVKEETQPAAQPVASGGRHAVRHRYIQQKRMAGQSAQAMNEIFMIKAVG